MDWKCSYALDLPCPNRQRLEVSENVKYIDVTSRASKLQVFKFQPGRDLNQNRPHGSLTVVCISVEKCIQFFSMAWQTFKAMLHPWQSGSLKILIGGFQKGKTRPCISRGTKVTRCQILKFFLPNLTSCNFYVPWGTRLCFTFLETSNQYLFVYQTTFNVAGLYQRKKLIGK